MVEKLAKHVQKAIQAKKSTALSRLSAPHVVAAVSSPARKLSTVHSGVQTKQSPVAFPVTAPHVVAAVKAYGQGTVQTMFDPYKLQQEAFLDDEDEDFDPFAGKIVGISGEKFKGLLSTQIGGSNQDCVLAAFASMGKNIDKFVKEVTSTNEAIHRIAKDLKLSYITQSYIKTFIKKGCVFVRAKALYGSGYHAYCGYRIDERGRLIAWDPDADESFHHKAIPLSEIDFSCVFG